MTSLLKETEDLLSRMSRPEKVRLLQWVVADLGETYPGIEFRHDVCGGAPCIVRTRIPVWILVQARKLGMQESDILRNYPTLNAQDLTEAWAYYRAHQNAVDAEITANEAE